MVGAELVHLATALAVDAAAKELADALRREGVEPVLLKGPTLAAWLYGDDAVRAYGDSDLLVHPAEVTTAERVLQDLGFRAGPGNAPPETPHARPWRRPSDERVIDLHWTISGSCRGPAETHAILQGHTQPIAVGGGELRALDPTAAALLVVLHASQHAEGKPLVDLRRVLERLSLSEWRAVASLADRLQADYGLSDGLRLDPAGARVAEALGLPPPALLNAAQDPRSALVIGIERLRRCRGWSARLRLIRSEVAPPPDFMRWRFAIARRSRRGLLAAYALRLAWLLWQTVPSLRAWRRTVRAT